MNNQQSECCVEGGVGISELSAACSLSVAELLELVEYGVLVPLDMAQPEPIFAIGILAPLRIAGVARRDSDWDLFVIVLLMDYLQRIAKLESQIALLQTEVLFAHG